MFDACCPHCGDKLPLARDAFCGTCGEPVDELPEVARSPEEQKAFRNRLEQAATQNLRFFGLLARLLRWF